MLLGRLQSDCKYYLGCGNRCKKQLWAGDEQRQIDKMKELYNGFASSGKPEWITYEEILEFERLMVNKEDETSKYKDKNGNVIKVGMKLKHNDGDIDEVLSSDDDLGFNATNPDFAKNHDIPQLIYPLSEFNLKEWEII
jgi:hypothetical protein